MAPSGCDYMPRVVSGLYIGPAFPTMSNVTGSQMLSHSMSVAGRPAEFLSVPHFLMESVGEPRRPTGADSKLLCLPTLSPWDDTEDPLEGLEGIKLKSSPIPRRRSSVSSDDSELPPSNSRRVSFADAFGLSLVTVKQFDARAVTGPPCPLESDLSEAEYYIIPIFTLPQTAEDLMLKVHQQKLELESLELLPGTTTLRGIVRVLNVCFDKTIYVRTSLDLWKSHFDLLAEYVPGSDCCETDRFSFKLTLVPPFGEEGTRVDFCLRYETSLGTFWSNNNEQNYSLFCCEKAKDKPQTPSESRIKSCLKVSTKFSSTDATSNEESLENDLIMSSVAESQSKEKEERQKEKELEEEMRRNHSQRHKRKAARMAKVKEFFAQREEEKTKGSGTDKPLLTDETNKQDHPSPEETPSGPQSQQISVGPPTCSQALTSSAECLTVDEKGEDPADILSEAVECHGEETMRSSEWNVLCNKSGSYSEIKVFENTDTLKEQTNSVSLSEHACRNSDISDGKNVEKAWEHFEQDAKQKIKSLTQIDEDLNVSHVNNMLKNDSLKKNPEPQLFTFGTIVAPFYQQAFKNMERERKAFILSAFHGEQSKKQESGMIRPLENDSTPIRHDTDVPPKAQKIDLTEFTEQNTTQTSQILISDLKHSREKNSSNINVIENSTIELLSLKMSLLHYATPPRAEQPIKRDSRISSFLPLDESPFLVNNEVLSAQPPLIFNSLCLESPAKSMCLLNQDRSVRVEQLNRTVYPEDTKMLTASDIELVSSEDNFQGIKFNFAQLSHTVSECYQEPLNTRTNVAFCEEHRPTYSPSNEEHENIIVIEPEVSQNERASMNKEELMERLEEIEIVIEEEIKYIDDDDEDSEICKWEPERKHKMITITDSKSLSVDFIQTEGRQRTNEGAEDVWWPQSSKTSELSDLTSIGDEWDLMQFLDKDDVCYDKSVKNKCEDAAENNMVDNTKGQGEDPTTGDLKEADEDNASTESLVDEEMDLYLYSLRNSNQSVLKEAGNYNKRPSISRGRTLSMPSILEEDQPNTFCEDLLNNTENGDALDEKDEQVVGQNVLWWREFLSYENLSRVCGYIFLFIAFLISAYYYDFNAYLALYLLTVYWLFCQKDGKSLKSSRKDK